MPLQKERQRVDEGGNNDDELALDLSLCTFRSCVNCVVVVNLVEESSERLQYWETLLHDLGYIAINPIYKCVVCVNALC